MKKIAFFGVFMSITSVVMAQNVIAIRYNNGNTRFEDVSDIKEMTFVSTNEIEDNTPNDITAGLAAYYTFDNRNCFDSKGQHFGFENGVSYITDTPNGTGYALYLKEGNYVSIGSAPLDGRSNYSFSFWMKDFSSGSIFRTKKNGYFTAPSLILTESLKLVNYTGESDYGNISKTFSADLSNYQSGQWVMVTVVCEQSDNQILSTLYIDGRKADSGASYKSNASGGTAMTIGEDCSLKLDNFRLYEVTLSEDNVADLYNREKEKMRVSISPQELFFDKDTKDHSFTIKNHTLNSMKFSINDNLGILKCSPSVDYIPAKGEQKVTVTVNDRDILNKYQRGCINVVTEAANTAIDVQITKGKDVPESEVEVARGLTAYYPFDNGDAKDVMPYEYDGTCNGGKFVSDTPNGKGKALLLKKDEAMLVGYAPLDGRTNYSVSLWVKDFGAGKLLQTQKQSYMTAPSLIVSEDLKLVFYTGESDYGNISNKFSADMSNYQSSQWTMLTIVCEPFDSQIRSTLYVNGKKADSGKSYKSNASGGTAMKIGGNYPMMIDNIRLYSVTLSEDEVAEIYASECK